MLIDGKIMDEFDRPEEKKKKKFGINLSTMLINYDHHIRINVTFKP